MTMQTREIGIGVIGCGSVSEHYMRQMAGLAGRARVLAAADTRAERRAWMASQGVPFVSPRYEDLLARPDVEAVLVLTSMNEHGPIAHAALAAGKHVLVEKPMATDFAAARELVALARGAGLTLMPAPHVVLSPTFKRIRAALHSGQIGQVLAARAMYGWIGPEWGRWFYQKGAGPIFDLGVYNITSLVALLGPAKRVIAMTGQVMPVRTVEGAPMRIETEDNAHILLDFGDGVLASVFTGFSIHDKAGPAIELYGSGGVLVLHGDDWAPDGHSCYDAATRQWTRAPEQAPDWHWTAGLDHFVDVVRDGAVAEITPEHGLHVLEIMLKAIDSGRDGVALPLTTQF